MQKWARSLNKSFCAGKGVRGWQEHISGVCTAKQGTTVKRSVSTKNGLGVEGGVNKCCRPVF
jgi:hypothetical protein